MRNLIAIMTIACCCGLSMATPPRTLDAPNKKPFPAEGEGPYFVMDFATFQGEENKSYIEFYFQMSFADIQFIKRSTRFQAGYAFDLEIADTSGSIVAQTDHRDSFKVSSYDETVSSQKARVWQASFTLPPGPYSVKAKVTDLETDKAGYVKAPIHLADYSGTAVRVSDLQLSHNIELASKDNGYVKSQRYIEPNASRTFSPEYSDLCIYFEIYNLAEGEGPAANYSANFTLFDDTGAKVAEIDRMHAKPGKSSAHSIRLPIDDLSSGDYRLRVRVIDFGARQVSETARTFKVIRQSIANVPQAELEEGLLY